jgi:hypothetical protein
MTSMEANIAAFAAQMAASNRRFIALFLDALGAQPAGPAASRTTTAGNAETTIEYDARLDTFARLLAHHAGEGGTATWPTPHLSPPLAIQSLDQLLSDEASLGAVLVSEDMTLDGIVRPPSSPTDRAEHQRLLRAGLQEQARGRGYDGDEDSLRLPVDYDDFLQVCDGVSDLDLRMESVCEIRGVGGVHGTNADEVAERIVDLDMIPFFEEWEIMAGWTLGMGQEAWCYYLLCRDQDDVVVAGEQGELGEVGGDDGEESESEWEWRIVYLSEDEPRVFGDLEDLLDWYCSWEDRIDVREAVLAALRLCAR